MGFNYLNQLWRWIKIWT